MSILDVFNITSRLSAFEAVLNAELSLLPLYVVTRKAAFDTPILVEAGALCFPEEVIHKVPEAVPDLEQGTKCVAFELPTAAGFHLHRANESILHRYWDAVTNNKPRPAKRNMGDYLAEMKKLQVGDQKVLAALRDLKDLHRNPLIHPEHSLETVDEAIALMNGVHNVMVHMLRDILFPKSNVSTTTLPTAPAPAAVSSSGRSQSAKKVKKTS